MTVQECYEKIGGNYREMLGRVMKDTLVQRFALKFLDDSSFPDLTAALEAGNTELAFRAAHTLKGVCGNLSFQTLMTSASAITEMLRGGDIVSAKGYYPTVLSDYQTTVEALRELKASL